MRTFATLSPGSGLCKAHIRWASLVTRMK